MPPLSVDQIIQNLELSPHPEGGYYKETYRAKGVIPQQHLPPNCQGERNYATMIYYLLPQGATSRLHRIATDEQWHFYLGGPMTVVEISPQGEIKQTVLGPDITKSHHLQHVVPAGHWFGAYPHPETNYALVGCVVAPGFDFQDFEIGERHHLLEQFPQAQEVIDKLT